jgi:hypothetical protein
VWSSLGQDGSGSGIYAQRFFGATGATAGNEFRVNTTTSGDQSDAAVGINRFTSEFVVTWTSAGQDGSGKGIYAQRFNASGVAQGTEFRVNTTTTGDQYDSSVAVDGAGEFYVLWTNAAVTANGLQVNGQQFDKFGVKKEGEFVVNATTAGDQSRASVSIDVFGRVTAVWSGNGSGDSAGVFSQRYRTDLHPLESAGDHDHGGVDDEVALPAAPAAVPSTSRGEAVHPWDALLAAVAEQQRQAIEEVLATTDAELAIESMPSEAEDSDDSFASAEAHLQESNPIDRLFGSDEWLMGRHYRMSSLQA